jgi:hypothetical protein
VQALLGDKEHLQCEWSKKLQMNKAEQKEHSL